MNEKIIQLAWQLQLFDQKQLRLKDGSSLSVLDVGQANTNAGPDFLFGKISIDGLILFGHIEIHVNSSDWIRHGHSRDPAYNMVVLHVVLNDDKEIKTQMNFTLPTLELKERLGKEKLDLCEELLGSLDQIPCANRANTIDKIYWHHWMDLMYRERVDHRVAEQESLLHMNNNDWENLCFQMLAKGFGIQVNRDVFHLLSQTIPWRVIQKHRADPFQIQAILFGQAGLLSGNFQETYPQQLRTEYDHLKKAYKLIPLQSGIWKFSRMRPASFPGIKIAQLASVLSSKSNLVSEILHIDSIDKLQSFLSCDMPTYWHDHYHFDRIGKAQQKSISKDFTKHICINFLVPFLSVYAKNTRQERFEDRAIELMESLKPEENVIIRKWESIGIIPEHAADSQALIQLKQNYCDQKACVRCEIGRKLILCDSVD
ncbi:MAG: DUF2851 family protein [Saprospiraceae bacterium]